MIAITFICCLTVCAAALYDNGSDWHVGGRHKERLFRRASTDDRNENKQRFEDAWQRLFADFVYFYERPRVTFVIDILQANQRAECHDSQSSVSENAKRKSDIDQQQQQQHVDKMTLNVAANVARRRLGAIVQPGTSKERRHQ